jgi:DNA-binding NtrC family response regulator
MTELLVVDDDPMMLRYVRSLLQGEGYGVRTAGNGQEALREMQKAPQPSMVLLDMVMPGMDGLETLDQMRAVAPNAYVVMLSGQHDPAGIVQAMKLGAADYLAKPVDEELLLGAVRRYAGEAKGKQEARKEEESELMCEELGGGKFFLAAAPAMKKLYEQLLRIARVDMPVLITGESGTGKEIIAQLLHTHSPRSKRSFLKINCAAIPEDLLESELFGYEAGAFTGAGKAKPGYFEQCDRGTILLDEIGEMPSRLQAKLLQVLQEQSFFRLGGKSPVKVDVRILAATNVDVKLAVEQGRLRLDLYYRLNGFNLCLPPLRERREEIVPLFRSFMKHMAVTVHQPERPLSDSMRHKLLAHAWPGNLRELHNVVKRYLVLGEESLPGSPVAAGEVHKPTGPRRRKTDAGGDLKQIVRELKGEAEAEAIRAALEKTHWRRKDAAALLGICYKALIYKSRQYGIISPREKAVPPVIPAKGARRMLAEDPATKPGGRFSSAMAVGSGERHDVP